MSKWDLDQKKKETSKYRKNEYMRRYITINGAKIAFKIPMNMRRLCNLKWK